MLMSRTIVSEEDLIRLWEFYFDSDVPSIREDTVGISIAVLGTKQDILKHHNAPGVEAFYQELVQLRDQGILIWGLVGGFSKALGESFADLSFDTSGAYALAVIPFKTQTDKDDVTAVMVIHGNKEVVMGGALTLYFKRLSVNGWEPTRQYLEQAYGVSIPVRRPAAKSVR